MKNLLKRITSSFALVGLASAIAAAVLPVPAYASYTEATITLNGVTCYKHTGGTGTDGVYPGLGNYYYCGTTQADHHGPVWVTAQSLAQGYPNSVGTKFPAPPATQVVYYVFKDCIDMKKWNSGLGSGAHMPTNAELSAWYSQSLNEAGFADLASHSVIVYENACKGTFTDSTHYGTVPNPSTRNTTAHESGHIFDVLYGTPSGNGTYFDHLAAYDKANMQAHDPNYNADMTAYGYFFTKSLTKYWAELFAAQFDAVTQGSGPAPSSPIPVLNNYWKCTAFYLRGYLANGVAPTYTYISQQGGSFCPQS